jgi:hypothetical protein
MELSTKKNIYIYVYIIQLKMFCLKKKKTLKNTNVAGCTNFFVNGVEDQIQNLLHIQQILSQ